MPEESVIQYLFDSPGLYRIRVVGKIDSRWLAHLHDLEIAATSWGHYPLVTQISGWLSDQTVLSGLLDLLTDLGRVILTVERLEVDEEIEETQRSKEG